jgi:hypothetical protein
MTSPNAPRMLTNDVPLTELTGEQLRARVARAQLYLLQAQPVADVWLWPAGAWG